MRPLLRLSLIASLLLAPAVQAAEPTLHDIGPAPAFTGIAGWLNSPPLTMQSLRGKVVLVDFWAYSCINCVRTLPFLIKWQTMYKDRGLVVIGVHTPEFKFEHDAKNVQAAIDRFGINYPVAQDNDMLTWNAFHNEYWPEEYLIDRQGRIVYTHAGEGQYDVTENAIRTLLDAGPAVGPEPGPDRSRIGSPEMYFGLDRVENLASPEPPKPGTRTYTAPATLKLNQFALSGAWTLSDEKATAARPQASIHLHCHAGKIFIVASSPNPVTLSITVDGTPQPQVTIHESRLYTLFDSPTYTDHTVTITTDKPGLSAFTFTFG
jgi:thiol-disulfide isomerase/thioredoxin